MGRPTDWLAAPLISPLHPGRAVGWRECHRWIWRTELRRTRRGIFRRIGRFTGGIQGVDVRGRHLVRVRPPDEKSMKFHVRVHWPDLIGPGCMVARAIRNLRGQDAIAIFIQVIAIRVAANCARYIGEPPRIAGIVAIGARSGRACGLRIRTVFRVLRPGRFQQRLVPIVSCSLSRIWLNLPLFLERWNAVYE